MGLKFKGETLKGTLGVIIGALWDYIRGIQGLY